MRIDRIWVGENRAISSQEFIDVARTYINTQHMHGGRLKGIGIDCVGLLVCSINELGGNIPLDISYTKNDEFRKLIVNLRRFFDKVENYEPGDVLVFRNEDMHNHVAIYTEKCTIIHAYDSLALNRVVEEPYTCKWDMRLNSVYRYKGMIK